LFPSEGRRFFACPKSFLDKNKYYWQIKTITEKFGKEERPMKLWRGVKFYWSMIWLVVHNAKFFQKPCPKCGSWCYKPTRRPKKKIRRKLLNEKVVGPGYELDETIRVWFRCEKCQHVFPLSLVYPV